MNAFLLPLIGEKNVIIVKINWFLFQGTDDSDMKVVITEHH